MSSFFLSFLRTGLNSAHVMVISGWRYVHWLVSSFIFCSCSSVRSVHLCWLKLLSLTCLGALCALRGVLNNVVCCCCWSLLHTAILRLQTMHLHVILQEWLAFYSASLNIHRSGAFTALTWLVPHETAAVSARSVYTIQPCIMSLHAKPYVKCIHV